jgi:hypothetical protein
VRCCQRRSCVPTFEQTAGWSIRRLHYVIRSKARSESQTYTLVGPANRARLGEVAHVRPNVSLTESEQLRKPHFICNVYTY